MSNRVTLDNLKAVCRRINKLMGTPEEYCTIDESGKIKTILIGHYHLNQAYGGVQLVQTTTSGGGVRDVLRIGYVSKAELYRQMFSFIEGIYSAEDRFKQQAEKQT